MKTLLETQQGYAGSKGMEDDGSYEEKGGVEGEQGSEEVQERPANDWPLICSDYDDEKPRARSTSIPKPEVDDDDDSTIMHGNDNNLDTKDDEGIQVLDSSQNLNIKVPDGRCGVVSPAIDRLLSSESDAGYGSGGELSPRPVVGSRSAEFQQRTNHKRMRDRFPLYEEKCYGYNHILKEPYLITILKEAKETRKPDFQRIYEAGRNYLGNHLALIYEIDTDHYTSLYHAAQLYEFNEVAGFIAECLFEAQYYCSIMDGFKYRVIEETYPPYGDNIFHCLARWHSDPHATARTLAAMANTLLGVASMRDLLNEKNKEGKLPFELCPPRSALQKLLRVTGASD